MSRRTPRRSDAGGQRLAQHYAHTMDPVDRCVRAAEEGNWPYLAQEAGGLSAAADELSAAASLVTTEDRATSPQDLLTAAEHRSAPLE